MTEEQKKELRNLIEGFYGQDYLLYTQNEIDNKVDKFISQAVKEERERIISELINKYTKLVGLYNTSPTKESSKLNELSQIKDFIEELKTNKQMPNL